MPVVRTCLLVLGLWSAVASAQAPAAAFPLQLSADIKVTAHLIPEDQAYPPRVRYMHIDYDYMNKLARADIKEGYEAEKTYIRHYDEENEYMIRMPPIDDCKRSYLGEKMPYPDLSEVVFVKEEKVDGGVLANHFVFEDFETLVHIWMAKSTGAPIKLQQGSFVDGVYTPLLSYDYSNVRLEQPTESLFSILKPFTHETCERQVGGFPYLHVFHYFVRF
jgi:hypothetical protein